MGRTAQIRLLLADNSADFRRSLRAYLELENYQVEEATSVEEATEKLTTGEVDIALVDQRLTDDGDPYDISGLEVAKLAGERNVHCIVITGYPSVEATRAALRSRGAEEPLALDFIPKSDGPQAIAYAMKAMQFSSPYDPRMVAGDLLIDLGKRMVWYKGSTVRLSRQQYSLLAYLCENKSAVCGPKELMKAVYDEDLSTSEANSDRRLERLIARVRDKIEVDAANPQHLVTVPGRGYRLLV